MFSFSPEWESEVLAYYNQEAGNPYEPFCGVQALFNADLNAVEPAWASREDWVILSRHSITYVPVRSQIEIGSVDE